MKKEEITLKNTKQEILDALNEALLREKNNAKVKSNPLQEEKERKANEAVKETKKNVENNIFSTELINKFNDLELAIATEEEKLKNLYGIEQELSNLTLVINSGKDLISELEDKKKKESLKIEVELKELQEEYNQKSNELTKEYDLKSKSLKVERERELEEYEYKIKREREIDKNKWDDEKKTREATLKSMEEEAKKILDEAHEKEDYIKDLEVKVADIPNLLSKECEKVRKEVTLELEKENKYQLELLKKDYQNTIDRQTDKIESLNLEIEKYSNLNANLQEKMDKAYAELKELATKTVEANGGVKILSSNNQNENK